MKKSSNKLVDLSVAFAIEILNLVKYLKSQHETIICNQIGRAGTSIGAFCSCFGMAVVLFKRDTIKPGDRPGYYSRPSNSLRSRSISFFNSSSLGR